MSAEETHKHKPKDIKPQGAGSGLDSDKVDGLHASEIGGGGPHNILSATHSDSLAAAVARGDLIIGDATPKWARLALTANRVLKSGALDIAWGLIVNADVDAAAAIAESKLALNYPTHAQLHAASHHTGGGDLLSLGSIPGTLVATQHPSGLGANLHHNQLHKDTHKTGGGDAFAVADLLDGIARVKVRKNSGAADVGSRRRLNFIEGTNVTLTVADDSVNEEVDVTIAAAGGGGTPESILMGCMFAMFSGLDVYSTAGTVTKYSWGLKIVTAAASPYKGYGFFALPAASGAVNIFSKNPQFELYLEFADVLYEVWVILGGTAGTMTTASEKKFGIVINRVADGSLEIVSSDGTTQSYSANLMTLSAATFYRIRVKLTSASQIEVWVDGVSKGTKATNLPSGAFSVSHGCPQIVDLAESGYTQTVYTSALKVLHDY